MYVWETVKKHFAGIVESKMELHVFLEDFQGQILPPHDQTQVSLYTNVTVLSAQKLVAKIVRPFSSQFTKGFVKIRGYHDIFGSG